MYQCLLCNRKFESVTRLVAHLTHPKSPCKINIKEYYDKFIKKENEGKCIYCGKETYFFGIEKGYLNDTCKHCKNKNPKTQNLRKKLSNEKKEKKKIESGYYDLPVYCEICKVSGIDKRFENIHGVANHVSQIHSDEISIKDYYDKYYKKEGEGICKITNEPTEFISMVEGYYEYKGKGTCSKDKKILEKHKKTLFKNYGVDSPTHANSDIRINNYKETIQKRNELQNSRINLINTLKILSVDKTNKIQCQICGEKYDNFNSITVHIFKKHFISIQDYYDKFFKKEGEGICSISGLATSFKTLEKGYYKYHKNHCQKSHEVVEASRIGTRKKLIERILKLQNDLDVEFDIKDINKCTDVVNIKCKICGNIYTNKWYNINCGFGKCPRCFPPFKNGMSKSQIEINEFIKEIEDSEILFGYRDLIKTKKGYKAELDIVIPKKKIAIEYNGLYWHSTAIHEDYDYHLHSTTECIKLGYRLIHIFEDEWIYKKDIVKNSIKNILHKNSGKRIFARKCEIKEIDSKIKNDFLEKYHMIGKDQSSIHLGAFFNNELVSVMTFGHGNISRGGNPKNKTSYELVRFCSNYNYHVVGISSKLLSYFKKHYDWNVIYSYADLRWSNGDMYKTLGFDINNISLPTYYYVMNNKRIHRYNLRKRYDEPKDKPEWVLRELAGFHRIYDCGKIKFIMKNT